MFKKKMMCLGIFVAILSLCGFTSAGDLEPTAPPAPTMKTLDEIPPTWSQQIPAADRFALVLNGEGVLDKETGLVWDRTPDPETETWQEAISTCYRRQVGGRRGWHLPTVEQLTSLIAPDNPQGDPDLPIGHPFPNVLASFYWTANTDATDPTTAWFVDFLDGDAGPTWKVSEYVQIVHVWCVRGGQSGVAY